MLQLCGNKDGYGSSNVIYLAMMPELPAVTLGVLLLLLLDHTRFSWANYLLLRLNNGLENVPSFPTDHGSRAKSVFRSGKIMKAKGGGVEKLEEKDRSRFVHVDDMALTQAQFATLTGKANKSPFRNGAFDVTLRWPDGVIPYDFEEGNKDVGPNLRSRIQFELKVLEYLLDSCIRFRPATAMDRNKVVFTYEKACSSNVGRMTESVNYLWFYESCPSVMHEMIHAIGFTHEFNRPDREIFADIQKDNVQEEYIHNFATRPGMNMTYDVAFNFYSIMAYFFDAFSKNGQDTIRPKVDVETEGLRLSWFPAHTDLLKIKRMYGCPEQERSCPIDHRALRSVCIKPYLKERLDWRSAEQHCKMMHHGGQLYEPRDYLAYSRVKEYIRQQQQTKEPMWIGIRRTGGDASYQSDGLKAAFVICPSFDEKEKSGAMGNKCYRGPADKDCLALDTDGRMNYFDCGTRFNFICEMPEKRMHSIQEIMSSL